MIMVHLIYSIIHTEMTPRNHVKFFLAQQLPIIKSLSYNTKTRFSVSVLEILCENIPLTEMVSSLKVAKKYMHVHCFQGKHFTCWDLRGMYETDNFGYTSLSILLATFNYRVRGTCVPARAFHARIAR